MNSEKEKGWVFIGQSTKPHGIKGAFHFRLESANDSVLREGHMIYLKPLSSQSSLSSKGECHTISKITFGHKVMAHLEGVEDRNAVEDMVPFEIYLSREDFPSLEGEDEFYLSDLKGMEVFEYETEKNLGQVQKVYDNSAQAVLLIGRGMEAFEIPFVEAFVPEVDIENKKIWVRRPEYR